MRIRQAGQNRFSHEIDPFGLERSRALFFEHLRCLSYRNDPFIQNRQGGCPRLVLVLSNQIAVIQDGKVRHGESSLFARDHAFEQCIKLFIRVVMDDDQAAALFAWRDIDLCAKCLT